jgi:hypothetical protein
MLFMRIVLCLALFAPCVGLAQGAEDAPAVAPSDPSALPPPPLVPAAEPSETEPAEAELSPHELETEPPPGSGFSMGRATFEFLGGGLGGASVGFVSLLLGVVVFSPICDSEGCIAPILLTGIVGATFGVPLGVYGAGKLLDGKGGYWPAFLGTLVGGGLGLTVALLSQSDDVAAGVAVTAGPVLGAIVGYELSHASAQSPAALLPQQSGEGLLVIPTLGLTPRGGIVGGLSGRF